MMKEYEKTISEAVSEIFKSLEAERDKIDNKRPDKGNMDCIDTLEELNFLDVVFVRNDENAPWVRALFGWWDYESEKCFAINPCNLVRGGCWKYARAECPTDEIVVEFEDILKIRDAAINLSPEQMRGIANYYIYEI